MKESGTIHQNASALTIKCDRFFDCEIVKDACEELGYGIIQLVVHQHRLKEVIPQPRIRR